MKIKALRHLALSCSLAMVACAPQAQISPVSTETLSAPENQASETVSFRFVKPAGTGFQTQFADLSQAAAVSLSLVGGGIRGTRNSERVPLVGGEATVTLNNVPLLDGRLRVVTAIAYDSAGNPLQAFVAKGFYTSQAGVTAHTIAIDRGRWLVGRALELLLASAPSTASRLDHASLQAIAETAFGSSDGQYLVDPTLFSPAALAALLRGGDLPDAAEITGTRIAPGQLLVSLSPARGGNFDEALEVLVNDPNSGLQTISSGSLSPQLLTLPVSPGSWTLSVRRPGGEVLSNQTINVDATGIVTSGPVSLNLSGVAETPVIESLSTTATSIGNTLTLRGRGFSSTDSENTVSFGSTEATVTGTPTNTSLDVLVPGDISGELPISVEVGGQSSNSVNFAVVPLLSAISPALVRHGAGATVTLTGSGFSAETVHLGGRLASVIASSNTSITVTTPVLGYGSRDMRVTVGSQSSAVIPLIHGDFSANSYTTGNQLAPAIAMDADGDFVIAWHGNGSDPNDFGVYAQRYSSAGLPQGGEFQVNTLTFGRQSEATVAMDASGNFVVSWQDSDNQIYARRFLANGSAVDSNEFRINNSTASFHTAPSVAMNDTGDFAVSWEGSDSNGTGVFVRSFNETGSPLSGDVRANSYTTGSQNAPAIAIDADGNFVIAWLSDSQDGSNTGIYAQRFTQSGGTQGSEFKVNTYTTDFQSNPAIASEANGAFVIAWQSNTQDGSGSGIYAQRYDTLGGTAGSEFRVNSYTTGTQVTPTLAMDADGDFVIAWMGPGRTAFNGTSIFARRFDAQGQAFGEEFLANLHSSFDQNSPVIAMDDDGDFAMAWTNMYEETGNLTGITAQRYTSTGAVTAPTLE